MTLDPLKEGLDPPARELAEFLREWFDVLDISVRKFATAHHWDPSVVSRFLSGERIPQTFDEFPAVLLTDAGLQRQRVPTKDDWERARDLHRVALRARNNKAFQLERIKGDLSVTTFEKQKADEIIDALSSRLLSRSAELDKLRAQLKELESVALNFQGRPKEIEPHGEEQQKIVHDCELVEQEIADLHVKLADEQRAMEGMERKSADLEVQLESANVRLKNAGGSSGDFDLTLQPGITAYFNDPALRGNKFGSRVAIHATRDLSPVYLGYIFIFISGAQLAVRLLTISELAIPIWLAYVVKPPEAAGMGKTAYIARLTIRSMVIFSVGVLIGLIPF